MLWTRPCETRRLSLQSGSTPQRWSGSGEPFSKGHPACTGRGFGRYTSSSDGATATASSAEETFEGAGQSARPSWSTAKPVDPEHSAAQGGNSDDHRALERWPFNGTLAFGSLIGMPGVRLRSPAANSSSTDNGPGSPPPGKNSGHYRRDPMKRESKSSDRDAPYGLMQPLVLRRIQRVQERGRVWRGWHLRIGPRQTVS